MPTNFVSPRSYSEGQSYVDILANSNSPRLRPALQCPMSAGCPGVGSHSRTTNIVRREVGPFRRPHMPTGMIAKTGAQAKLLLRRFSLEKFPCLVYCKHGFIQCRQINPVKSTIAPQPRNLQTRRQELRGRISTPPTKYKISPTRKNMLGLLNRYSQPC